MDPREALAHDAEQQRQRILSMKAGSELDALVAEKIFSLTPCDGWMPVNFGSAGGPALAKRCDHAPDTCYSTRTLGSIQGRIGGAPRYSTEAGAAMLVLDAWEGDWNIRRQNGHFEVYLYQPSMQGSDWADTLPLAICRMRLRAALAWTR